MKPASSVSPVRSARVLPGRCVIGCIARVALVSGRHQDRAQPHAAGVHDGVQQFLALLFQFLGELVDQDGVLARQPHQHHQRHLGEDVQVRRLAEWREAEHPPESVGAPWLVMHPTPTSEPWLKTRPFVQCRLVTLMSLLQP